MSKLHDATPAGSGSGILDGLLAIGGLIFSFCAVCWLLSAILGG